MGFLSSFQHVTSGVATSNNASVDSSDDGSPTLRFFGKTCARVGIVVAALIGVMILVWAAMYFMG